MGKIVASLPDRTTPILQLPAPTEEPEGAVPADNKGAPSPKTRSRAKLKAKESPKA
jgi:hypothetical protein